MKITANKLVDFVEKISLKGKINTSVLNFADDGLNSMVTSSNIAFVSGSMAKEAFQEYDAIGEVGIKNNGLLIKILKRYGANIIKLELQDNKLVIVSETGSTYYILANKDMIDNHIAQAPPIDEKLDAGVDIDTEKFDSIKNGAEAISTKEIIIDVKDKRLNLMVVSEIGDKITEELACEYKDVKCKYGSFLLDTIDVMSGKVNMSFNEAFPIRIKEKADNITMSYIIAPIVDSE